VIEGVVMRGKRDLAIAVRRTDDTIIIEEEELSSLVDRYKFLSWPVIRGTVVLVETMIMGIRALNFSANQVAEAEGEEITPVEMTITMLVALVLAAVLFVAIPTGAVHFMRSLVESVALQNLVEGIIRIAVFLGYVWLVAQMDDIKRVFEYHGAEHKVIYTYEAGEPLTVENARPTIHSAPAVRHCVFTRRDGGQYYRVFIFRRGRFILADFVPGLSCCRSWPGSPTRLLST